jgi:hypothetical protein
MTDDGARTGLCAVLVFICGGVMPNGRLWRHVFSLGGGGRQNMLTVAVSASIDPHTK